MRAWGRLLARYRSSLAVRGDNMAMLSMLLHLRPPVGSQAMTLLSREMAMVYATWPSRPVSATHVPGIANVLPDWLSRVHQPGHATELPSALAKVSRTLIDPRTPQWYVTRSLDAPLPVGR